MLTDFPEKHPYILIFAKSPDSFCFREKNTFLCKNNIFSNCSRSCSCLTYIFAKTFEKTNIFTQILAKINIFANIFAKICQNIMSSKYFHKNSPLFHLLLISFAFFLRNFRNSPLLSILAKIFIIFAYFCQIFFAEIRRGKFSFQP